MSRLDQHASRSWDTTECLQEALGLGQPHLVACGHLALGLSRSLQELDVVHQHGSDLLDSYKDFFVGIFLQLRQFH